jgi:hypothetical protein
LGADEVRYIAASKITEHSKGEKLQKEIRIVLESFCMFRKASEKELINGTQVYYTPNLSGLFGLCNLQASHGITVFQAS